MQENDRQENNSKWKLWFKSRSSAPFEPQYGEYDTKDAALRAACEMMKVPGKEVLRIEGPNGERIERNAIARYCDSLPKTPDQPAS
jgi:hypothetical protein